MGKLRPFLCQMPSRHNRSQRPFLSCCIIRTCTQWQGRWLARVCHQVQPQIMSLHASIIQHHAASACIKQTPRDLMIICPPSRERAEKVVLSYRIHDLRQGWQRNHERRRMCRGVKRRIGFTAGVFGIAIIGWSCLWFGGRGGRKKT